MTQVNTTKPGKQNMIKAGDPINLAVCVVNAQNKPHFVKLPQGLVATVDFDTDAVQELFTYGHSHVLLTLGNAELFFEEIMLFNNSVVRFWNWLIDRGLAKKVNDSDLKVRMWTTVEFINARKMEKAVSQTIKAHGKDIIQLGPFNNEHAQTLHPGVQHDPEGMQKYIEEQERLNPAPAELLKEIAEGAEPDETR